MGLIPQSFIDDLVARADIVELINARVPLKRKGKEYMACCPFHNEKTPSFTVSETKQFYHCFGCGAHGTALGFLMQYDNMEFVEAVEELAHMYNLEVPREQGHAQARDDRQPLFDVLAECGLLYQQQLKSTPKAVDYLKGRGLTGEVAKRYQLGYAPEGWGFLADRFAGDQGKTTALVKTGMLVTKESGGHYDRFRDRIMFPITNRRGKVIGFGGRVIEAGSKDAKYLNSPENALFHKGQEVYGLYEAKRATRELKQIVVVEGYMDVVALAQFDIPYAVACLGTATTREQIQLILRSCNQVVFCYDGDLAGRKAAWRACQNTLEVIRDGQHARFLFLPDGEDPDSLVRKEGRESFEHRLEQATPLSDFLFDQLSQDTDITIPEGKAKLAGEARPLLNRMQDSLLKDLLFEKLAELTDVAVDKLHQPLPQDTRTTPPSRQQPAHTAAPSGLRNAMALLLQYPDLCTVETLDDSLQHSDAYGVALLYALYLAAKQNPQMSSAALLERFREHADFAKLQKQQGLVVPGAEDTDTRIQTYRDSVRRLMLTLKRTSVQSRLQELTDKAAAADGLSADEKQEFKRLLEESRGG